MSKKYFHIFTIADFREEENWLQEKAKAGLKLAAVSTIGNYTFEEAKPEDVIYRMVYQNESASSQDKKAYSDAGWEYVLEQNGWIYFRKAAADASEADRETLVSEAASHSSMIDRIIKTRMLPMICLLFCFTIPLLIRQITQSTHTAAGLTVLIVLAAIVFIEAALIVGCTGKLRKLKKEYKVV